jgi:hypothetical protein
LVRRFDGDFLAVVPGGRQVASREYDRVTKSPGRGWSRWRSRGKAGVPSLAHLSLDFAGVAGLHKGVVWLWLEVGRDLVEGEPLGVVPVVVFILEGVGPVAPSLTKIDWPGPHHRPPREGLRTVHRGLVHMVHNSRRYTAPCTTTSCFGPKQAISTLDNSVLVRGACISGFMWTMWTRINGFGV